MFQLNKNGEYFTSYQKYVHFKWIILWKTDILILTIKHATITMSYVHDFLFLCLLHRNNEFFSSFSPNFHNLKKQFILKMHVVCRSTNVWGNTQNVPYDNFSKYTHCQRGEVGGTKGGENLRKMILINPSIHLFPLFIFPPLSLEYLVDLFFSPKIFQSISLNAWIFLCFKDIASRPQNNTSPMYLGWNNSSVGTQEQYQSFAANIVLLRISLEK